jgi:hypothetical protein
VENLIGYIGNHTAAAIFAVVVTLLILVFIGKKLFKLGLLLIFILLVVCGYYCYKAPEEFPKKVKTAIGETRDKTEEIVGKGKKILNNLDRIMKEKKETTTKE